MNEQDGLVFAYLLNGEGGGRALKWQEAVDHWHRKDKFVWIHLDRGAKKSQRWLMEKAGIDRKIWEMMLDDRPVPNSVSSDDRLFVVLRGVNPNQNEKNPESRENMIAVRLWIEPDRAISVRRLETQAIQEVKKKIEAGEGPKNAPELLVDIANSLVGQMRPEIEGFEEKLDNLEKQVLKVQGRRARRDVRKGFKVLRLRVIQLKRHIAPQRNVMWHVKDAKVSWLNEFDRGRLRAVANEFGRLVDDLEEIRDRAQLVYDELTTRLSETIERNTYFLSRVAFILLPPTFLAGVLGVNLGVNQSGIQIYESADFWIFCGIVFVVMVIVWVLVAKLYPREE